MCRGFERFARSGANDRHDLRGRLIKRGETALTKSEIDSYFNDVYSATFKAVSRFVACHASNFHDCEDIIQNVYTRFFKRISEKGFEDIESPEAFVINIAKFECRTFLSGFIKRRENIRNFGDYSEEESAALEADLSRDVPLMDEVLGDKLLARQIFDDIMKNDEVTGQIFYLHFVCDMKLDEISKRLGLNVSTVKTKMYRTIERQKKKFDL